MTIKEIISCRLANQRITSGKLSTPAEVVSWLGALQAQDYGMVKWAVGLRLDNASHDRVERAIDQGQILRTHVLRPTWHLVHPKDIRWMLALSSSRIRAVMAQMERKLELDDKIFRRCKKIMERALVKDKHLTRADLISRIEKAGIATNETRSSHILMQAELDGLICNGPRQGRQIAYALLEERVPPAPKLSRDESLAELARRYFTSHGPATLHDFAWWSGLTVTDAKKGMEMNAPQWLSATIRPQKYWFIDPPASSGPPVLSPEKLALSSGAPVPPNTSVGGRSSPVRTRPGSAFLLPAFDEWIVSYADRSALLDPAWEKKIATNNGIFKPVMVYNGKITGMWRRVEKKGEIDIVPEWFHPVSPTAKKAMASACKRYIAFLRPFK